MSAAFQRDKGVVALTEQVLVNGLFGEGLALFTSTGELQHEPDGGRADVLGA